MKRTGTRRISAEELKRGTLLASACLPSERHPDRIPILEAADMLTEPCSACGASVGASCDVTTRGARGATIVDGIDFHSCRVAARIAKHKGRS